METKATTYKWFKKWILDDDHPCLMAQSVFRTDHVDYHEYKGFGTSESVDSILRDLENYLDRYNFSDNQFFTFIAAFPQERCAYTEVEFEKLLWRQLQFLHDADDAPWDSSVTKDPDDSNFSFRDRKSTRLNSSHVRISYAVFFLKKKIIF